MTNLPAVQNTTLESLGGQAALFADPALLLDVDGWSLKEMALKVGAEAGTVFAQIRRAAGLLAWAGWFKFNKMEYIDFSGNLADDLGIEVSTLLKWRQNVIKAEELAIPEVARQRAESARTSRKPAGQTASAGQPSSNAKSGPVIIETTATESPVTQKAIGSDVSEQVVITGNGAESMRDATKPDLLDNASSGGVDAGSTPEPAQPTAPDVLSVNLLSNDVGELVDVEPPTVKQQIATLHSVLADLSPVDMWNESTDEQREQFATYVNEVREVKAAAKAGQPKVPPRRQGTITTPADRAKAKLAEVIVDDPDGVAPDLANCPHPRAKRKQLPYFTLCTDCGRKVA